MDGTTGVTQCPVPPGQSFVYNFTVENQFGTYWFHAHFSTQSGDGVVGPLIIHAPEEAQIQQSYDFDQVIMLQDWYHDLTGALLPSYLGGGNENKEPVPDNGLIQGENYFNCSSYGGNSRYKCANNSSRPVFSFEQNKRYRLRFINSGAFTPFQMSVDNHTMDIIESDSTLVSPLPVHRFEMAVAERYSVILHTNQSNATNYWIRGQMNTNCFTTSNRVLNPTVLALLTYTNTTSSPTASGDWADSLDDHCQDLNTTLLAPLVVEQAPPADVLYEIEFSFNITGNDLNRAFINGTSWTPSVQNPTLNQAIAGISAANTTFLANGVASSAFSSNQYVISLPTVQVVDLLVLNLDDGAHPFHLHGHVFWIMAQGTEQFFPWESGLYSLLNSTMPNDYTNNPIRRDTFTISEHNWALIRFRNDNPGLWAFHCHNAWHMEAGLFMQFISLQDVMKTWTLPSSVLELCKP
jgi:FtsP/CotA-like multicopper oxidase with cupredoxin domain